MAKSGKLRTRLSPPSAALTSTTIISTSSSPNPASSSPYFLPDLIPLVASRLMTLQDFFALRAACRAYRARLPPSSSNLASQGPLLLVRHKASTSDALFHVPLGCILRFRLRRARGNPIVTCLRWLILGLTSFHSLGCRVAIQDGKGIDTRPEIRIRHLLTGERARLPNLPVDCDGVIFSGDLIIACTHLRNHIYHCRIGDAHWQPARYHGGYQLLSLISVKGTLFALIYPNYGLATVALDKNSVVLSLLEDKLSAQAVLNRSTLWLAECHGELLLIVGNFTTMFSGGSPGRGSGRELKALVVVACSLIVMSLQVALVQIIREFEEIACILLETLGTGKSILWLMDLRFKLWPTTQGEHQVKNSYQWPGSFQAFADTVQCRSELSPTSLEIKITCCWRWRPTENVELPLQCAVWSVAW